MLANAFVAAACGQVGRPVMKVHPLALDALARSEWPGNVRQLENIIFRIVSLAEQDEISIDDVRAQCGAQMLPTSAPAAAPALREFDSYSEAFDAFENELLTRLLPQYPSTRRLALRLGLSHTAIANKLRRLGIQAP
jgi:TyrR family helix-turn-helix protein